MVNNNFLFFGSVRRNVTVLPERPQLQLVAPDPAAWAAAAERLVGTGGAQFLPAYWDDPTTQHVRALRQGLATSQSYLGRGGGG